jgi:hypothetical protein
MDHFCLIISISQDTITESIRLLLESARGTTTENKFWLPPIQTIVRLFDVIIYSERSVSARSEYLSLSLSLSAYLLTCVCTRHVESAVNPAESEVLDTRQF